MFSYTVAYGDLDCDGTYSTFFQGVKASRSADMIHNCTTAKMGGIGSLNETE